MFTYIRQSLMFLSGPFWLSWQLSCFQVILLFSLHTFKAIFMSILVPAIWRQLRETLAIFYFGAKLMQNGEKYEHQVLFVISHDCRKTMFKLSANIIGCHHLLLSLQVGVWKRMSDVAKKKTKLLVYGGHNFVLV